MEIAQLIAQTFAALYLILGTLYISSFPAAYLTAGESRLDHWCAVCTIGLYLSSLGFHILIHPGLFNLVFALTAVTLLMVLTGIKGPGPGAFFGSIFEDLRRLHSFFTHRISLWPRCLSLAALLTALFILARILIIPPLANDTMTYHGVKAATWVQSGHFTLMNAPGPMSIYRYFFGGGELLQAWAMLPFHGDALVGLVGWTQWLFLMSALFACGRLLGFKEEHCLAGSLFIGFMPAVSLLVGSGYVDLAWTLNIILALNFTLLFFRTKKKSRLALVFAALALACGTKLTAVFPASVLTLIIVIFLYSGFNRRRAILILMALGIALPVTGPWIIHNIHQTGYPLAPYSITLGPLVLGKAVPAAEWYFQNSFPAPYKLINEYSALKMLFNYPFRDKAPNFTLLGLVPLIIFPVSLSRIIKLVSVHWSYLPLFGIIGSVLAFYYSPNFSFIRLVMAEYSARFLLIFMALIVMVGPAFSGRGLRRLYLYYLWAATGVFIVLIYLAYFRQGFKLYHLLVWFGLIIILIVVYYSTRRLSGVKVLLIVVAVVVGFTPLVLLLRQDIRPMAPKSAYFFHRFPVYWRHAARLADVPDRPKRIAITAGPHQNADNWFVYYFMGRNLQNRLSYIPISPKGEIIPFGPEKKTFRSFSAPAWLSRLKKTGMTHFLSLRPLSVELTYVRSRPDIFEFIAGGQEWGLFKIREKPLGGCRSGRPLRTGPDFSEYFFLSAGEIR